MAFLFGTSGVWFKLGTRGNRVKHSSKARSRFSVPLCPIVFGMTECAHVAPQAHCPDSILISKNRGQSIDLTEFLRPSYNNSVTQGHVQNHVLHMLTCNDT
eukprot:sb/3478550/